MLDTSIFTCEKLTDVITRVRMPGNVFAYIATGSERSAVIDTGFGLGPFREYCEEIIGNKPYELILTHGHFDHSGGASQFDKVWMHPDDLQLAQRHTDRKMRSGFLARDGWKFEWEDLAGEKLSGYLPLEYRQRFDLGNEILEIVNLGGHTPGSIGILFINERILLAGDACCSFTLLFGGKDSLNVKGLRDNLIDSWHRYKDCFDTVLYSHPHNYGGPEVIEQMIELCNEILEGKDDRIERPGMFSRKSYVAKATGENGRRLDGKIANLQYAEDCI